MSRIQISELKQNASELKVLSERESGAIIGGNDTVDEINLYIDISTIFQINNNINVQIAINGDNLNLAELNNIAEELYS